MNTIRSKTELKIYRILGIESFRHFLFRLEKSRHRKDGRVNSNYHLKKGYAGRIQSFFPFLLYNSFIHILGLFVGILYLVVRIFIIPRNFFWADFIIIVTSILNLYCLLLQRYSFLRIKNAALRERERREDRIQRKLQLADPTGLSVYGREVLEGDMALLKELKQTVENRRSFIFQTTHNPSLERFCTLVPEKSKKDTGLTREPKTVSEILDELKDNKDVITNLDVSISGMLVKKGKGKYAPVAGSLFSTKSKETESLYRCVFPMDNADSVEETVEYLIRCYNSVTKEDT